MICGVTYHCCLSLAWYLGGRFWRESSLPSSLNLLYLILRIGDVLILPCTHTRTCCHTPIAYKPGPFTPRRAYSHARMRDSRKLMNRHSFGSRWEILSVWCGFLNIGNDAVALYQKEHPPAHRPSRLTTPCGMVNQAMCIAIGARRQKTRDYGTRKV